MGHMLFLVKPCEQTDKLPVYEPEVEVEDGPAASEPAAPTGENAEQHGRWGISWVELTPAACVCLLAAVLAVVSGHSVKLGL